MSQVDEQFESRWEAEMAGQRMPIWPEAEVIAMPEKQRMTPTVLVRRRASPLVSADGAEIEYFESNPCISIYTGAGGADLGLENAGFITVVQHEWAYEACLTLMGNRPRYFRHAALIQGDIRQTPTSMLLREARLRVGEAHLLVGGPPCQGFSYCNSNRGKSKDSRNDLVFEFLRVADEAKPRTFLFENVPGFMELNKGEYAKRFLRRAYDCYYDLVYGLVDACDYGVPQRRTRFICMGTRRDLSEIEGAMAALPKAECFDPHDLKRLKLIKNKPAFAREYEDLTRAPGIRYFPDRPILFPPKPNGEDGRTDRYKEFYRRLADTEPDRLVFKVRNGN